MAVVTNYGILHIAFIVNIAHAATAWTPPNVVNFFCNIALADSATHTLISFEPLLV
ncbi:hypothetical protein [Psychrobacter immobilis]|uniref:hypothetical protein n=1 Tax=Psychrobacter immobilis TaxID=498 RepID=UPI003FD5902D